MLEQMVLNWSTVVGAYIVVFGMLRYIDDVVEVLASVSGSSATALPEESGSSYTVGQNG